MVKWMCKLIQHAHFSSKLTTNEIRRTRRESNESYNRFSIQSSNIKLHCNEQLSDLREFMTKATRCQTIPKTQFLIRHSPFSGLQRPQAVLLTHGDSIERVCDKFKICATSSSDIVAGIYNEQTRVYGVQFHPEVDLTLQGKKMLANFLFEIARITPNYTMASRKDECIRYIREKVGSNKVLVRRKQSLL